MLHDSANVLIAICGSSACASAMAEAANGNLPLLYRPILTHGQRPDLSGVKTEFIAVWFSNWTPTIWDWTPTIWEVEHAKSRDVAWWANQVAYMPMPDLEPEDEFEAFYKVSNGAGVPGGTYKDSLKLAFEAGRKSK